MVHTVLLDFKFKPSMIVTGQMWFSELIQGCESFKELVEKETNFGKLLLLLDGVETNGSTFEKYVKHLHQMAIELEELVRKLLTTFESGNLTYLPEYRELKSRENDFKVAYTQDFRKFHAGILETLEDGINPHKTVSQEKSLRMCRSQTY